jgi:hypothetical protein
MSDNNSNILESLSKGMAVDRAAGMSHQAIPIVVQAPRSNEGCIIPKPTEFIAVDMNNLVFTQSDIFENTITNNSAFLKYALIGCGILGSIAAFATNFGFSADAGGLTIASVGCIDDFGASTKKLAWLNSNIAGNKAILKSIKVRTSDADQIAQPITAATINLNGEIYKTKRQFTEVDTNLNYAMLQDCALPINFYQGFLYPILPGQTVQIEATIAGIETQAGMAPKLAR